VALVPLSEAQALVWGACRRLAPTSVPVGQALGLVCATEVVAAEPVPPFDNTAMDGYAVRAADTEPVPARLKVTGTLAAGDAPHQAVGPGEAVRIMTGAPLPPGADAVVKVEDTEAGDGVVVVRRRARPGDHLRRAGEDLRPGSVVFPAGTRLGPAHLGVLASLGLAEVAAYPRPRVGVLSTGDELVAAGPLGPGQVRDANRPALVALAAEAGFDPVDLGLVGDDQAQLEETLARAAAGCDAVVASGGASVGDFDLMQVVLSRLGQDSVRWLQVAIKPAKPLAFGLVGGTPVFGLPGNPVSSLVSFELFARPALRKMMGFEQPDRPLWRGVAAEAMRRRPDGKVHFVRAVAEPGPDGRLSARLAGGQGSHVLSAMARANALAVLPDGEGVAEGECVELMLLGPDR
jgi:molybdopterin molybdotransferase